ncbi:MAG: hypothetical protein RLZZ444_3196, partial [Pseudomonadota bacterium]
MRRLTALSCIFLLSGCVSERHIGASGKPTLTSIVNHIQCEVYNAWKPYADKTKDQQWLAAVTLTLSDKTAGSLAPSISAGGVVDIAAPISVVSGNFGLSRAKTSTESYSFVIDIRSINPHVCDVSSAGGILIGGDIGVSGVVDSALQALMIDTYSKSLGFTEQKTFGKSIAVTLTRQVTALGPTWTLTHFRGPGPFLGMSRESTDI